MIRVRSATVVIVARPVLGSLDRDPDIYGIRALKSCRARTERLFYSFPKANEAAPPWRALEPSVREAVGGASTALQRV
jgi:hypothetical protein